MTHSLTMRAACLPPLLGLLIASAAHAQPAAKSPPPYHPPRTALGQPDLEGVWTNSSLTSLERTPIFKSVVATDAEEKMFISLFRSMAGSIVDNSPIDPNGGPPPVVKSAPQADFLEMDLHLAVVDGQKRSSWIVSPADGKVPFTDAGKAAYTGNKSSYDGPESRPLTERCLVAVGSPESPPMLNTGFNAHYQIVQTPDTVAILVEMNSDLRIVRMKDRTHPPQAVRRWLGDSVGRWEGETLVVETTNFDVRAAVDSFNGGFRYGPNTKVTERFTRISNDRMLYQFTVEDADYFKQPWKGEMPMRAAAGPIYEYACHEGNYSLANALSGRRYEEAAALRQAQSAAPIGAIAAEKPAP